MFPAAVYIYWHPKGICYIFVKNKYALPDSPQGWSFSDVMYVTKHNMANAVASVSKQLENVSEALAVSQELSTVWIICIIYANNCSHTFSLLFFYSLQKDICLRGWKPWTGS